MVYSYFPGCTLKTKAKDLDRYGRESAKALGFELEEIENWQCCQWLYLCACRISDVRFQTPPCDRRDGKPESVR